MTRAPLTAAPALPHPADPAAGHCGGASDSPLAAELPDAEPLAGAEFLADTIAPITGILAASSAAARENWQAEFNRFGAIAGALEEAAAAIARLDTALAGHPLAPAWAWRSRLEAVRRQAAADGRVIDPWHLAAAIEGVRFRLDAQTIIDRGEIFDSARHAFGLWRWYGQPDEVQTEAIERAAAALSAAPSVSPLIGAALAVHSWLDDGGERPPLRAALAREWQRRGLMHIPAPLLTGARAFRDDAPRPREAWVREFLKALAEEAEWGLQLLRRIERDWFAARAAVRSRRRGSHAAAAVDILAAAPVISATSLAAGLGIAIKNATALLEGFVACGVAIEVTHRSKRRLFGLKHLAPLRQEARPPGRGHRSIGRGGEMVDRPAVGRGEAEFAAATGGDGDTTPPRLDLALSPTTREELEPIDFEEWMRQAEQLVRRSRAVLDRLAPAGVAAAAGLKSAGR